MANLSVIIAARLHGVHCLPMQIFSAREKVERPLRPCQANDGSQRKLDRLTPSDTVLENPNQCRKTRSAKLSQPIRFDHAANYNSLKTHRNPLFQTTVFEVVIYLKKCQELDRVTVGKDGCNNIRETHTHFYIRVLHNL